MFAITVITLEVTGSKVPSKAAARAVKILPDHDFQNVTIINRLGLHARAATRLVNCTSEFNAEILVKKGARVGQWEIHYGCFDAGRSYRNGTDH